MTQTPSSPLPADLPPSIHTAYGYVREGIEVAQGWILSPAAWSQFALLVVAYLVARFLAARFLPKVETLLRPADAGAKGALSEARRVAVRFLPLGLPLLAYVFTGLGENVTRSIFGSGAVIAFGKRVFLLLAARALVNSILKDPFLKVLGKYALMPIMILYTLGLLDPAVLKLSQTIVGAGNIKFSLLSVIRGLLAGSVLFWLGRWSTGQSRTYIVAQETMRPATRELASKAAEIAIFGLSFLLLMNIIGMDLSTLAVLGGAIGVGIGFGLQRIASNFISGVILLLEGQATVGDFVELDGGEAGTIVKMTARAAILETYDGRWIVVPNEDFITTRVVNYSDSGSANRYEAAFSVSYDTDINTIPDLINAAVAKHPDILDAPYPPDCELRGFGDSGIDFAVEFWVNGLDEGDNKYTSDVLFLIWNALKDNNIEIPYPHQVVEFKNGLPPVAKA
ncbi:mechanosensitive ion channel family protein [Pacificibacter marinus]|uniref:Mechanosensitive channel MscK n=1 Tax=Pacificibacter marinus TaxID=658057 RepID=A0A1Y5RBB9_9RHOB|nr:mechanosensitive ion channel domain-containing protein [Pacificibacter marinus]SEK25384.1 Mechanosensitive ion channel [Pacificibacter marinus]SLN13105.1 Mechanosensitive channel MscK precursor [Pacificibacter marinus]